ncbi:MAG: gamma carbonic anhydrase family protein [Alphaproteobacteria bacterium]|nr:gamma carbonic anhydrase family protein [Alphaproteobacteria bacterium]
MEEQRFGPDVILDRPAYIDPTARIFGKVSVAEGASLWPYSVVRAEVHDIRIGRFSNIQDHAVLHVGSGGPTIIGDYCSIAHHAVLHSATIGDNSLIGINATLMDGVVIGRNCIVAGGAFLSEGKVIPDDSIVMGMPGKVVRTKNNFLQTRRNALIYHRNALAYARGDHRAWCGPDFEIWQAEILKTLEAEFSRLYPDTASP